VLLVLHLLALFAPFISPYRPDSMDRGRFYQPPDRVHWVATGGGWQFGPHICGMALEEAGAFRYRAEPARRIPVRFLVRGEPYRLFGLIPADRHLFGVEAPERILLFGGDGYGRDVFSRLLHGAQVSLAVGLVGIAISFALGLLLGGLAGYLGGWVDALIMRASELLLAIPGLYLVIALRTLFPLDLPGGATYLAIVAILALIGWASLARVIRGMALSIRRMDYVAAAEALGAGRIRVLWRHILPNTLSFVVVAATLAVPGYILGEVFLSFLGVGVQEPAASWGNMLHQARSLRVLGSFPWMVAAPGLAILVTVMAYNLVGDGLRDALDPRDGGGSGSA
jgi:peptide/nickel transport system permease protein